MYQLEHKEEKVMIRVEFHIEGELEGDDMGKEKGE